MDRRDKKTCLNCKGIGAIYNETECWRCNGYGYLVWLKQDDWDVTCSVCFGSGKIRGEISCDQCSGKGYRDWVDEIRRPEKSV